MGLTFESVFMPFTIHIFLLRNILDSHKPDKHILTMALRFSLCSGCVKHHACSTLKSLLITPRTELHCRWWRLLWQWNRNRRGNPEYLLSSGGDDTNDGMLKNSGNLTRVRAIYIPLMDCEIASAWGLTGILRPGHSGPSVDPLSRIISLGSQFLNCLLWLALL
jgi:hypothetical protein